MTTTFSIESALDAYVKDESEDRQPDGKWHPSSMFGCERKAIYQVRGVPEDGPISPRLRRIFFLGTTFHVITQKAVSAMVAGSMTTAYHEVGIKVPSLDIVGHGDSVVIFEDGSFDLCEYKSINEWGLKSVIKSDIPKSEHIGQALSYLYCLTRFQWTSTEDGAEVIHPPLTGRGRVRIAYLGKDALDTAEFFVYPTEQWDRDFEAYHARLERYKADGSALPPRLEDKTKYPCAYCSFKTRCWDIDKEGVDL